MARIVHIVKSHCESVFSHPVYEPNYNTFVCPSFCIPVVAVESSNCVISLCNCAILIERSEVKVTIQLLRPRIFRKGKKTKIRYVRKYPSVEESNMVVRK